MARNVGSVSWMSASRSSCARSCGLSLKYHAAHSPPRQVVWANVSPCPAQRSKAAVSRVSAMWGTTARKAFAHAFEVASRRWAQTSAASGVMSEPYGVCAHLRAGWLSQNRRSDGTYGRIVEMISSTARCASRSSVMALVMVSWQARWAGIPWVINWPA